MADFDNAFKKMMVNEGGYNLHKVKHDRGGMTFAGIAEKFHPDWPGWDYIKHNPNFVVDMQLIEFVKSFYRRKFWDKIMGDKIVDQEIANTLFDFAVNAGHRTAIKLLQKSLLVRVDGILGPITVGELNKQNDLQRFLMHYALLKIAYYAGICNRKKSQKKFLLGWVNRALRPFTGK